MKKVIKISEEKYMDTFKKNEQVKILNSSVNMYKMLKNSEEDITPLEPMRENFYGLSPHANIDMLILSDLKILSGELVFNEQKNMFCTYGENSCYIEGGFIGKDIFRIMNIDVFYKYRNEGLGTKLMEIFLEEIESRFNVYCFNVHAQNQYAPENEMDEHTERLEKFYAKFGFEKSHTKMVKPKGTSW